MTKIRIGTASWTDPGFVEDWYPPKLPAGARLRWYAEHFSYVEVNATFYALPTVKTVERWVTETPDDFLFDVKLPKVLSRHAMRIKFLPPDLRAKIPDGEAPDESLEKIRVSRGRSPSQIQTEVENYIPLTRANERLIVQRLLRELRPLSEAKKLGAFLLQLSPSFRPRNHQLSELDSIRDLLAPHALAVELRNRDWVVGEQRDATIEYFRSRQITFVLVDAPESEHFTVMPGMNCVTNRQLAYFRLHGRNAEGYIRGRSVAERFDYDYSPAEVTELAERVRDVAGQVDELHIAANNNRSNYAPKLARMLEEKLAEQKDLEKALRRAPPARQKQLL